jgi:hypothetical protein
MTEENVQETQEQKNIPLTTEQKLIVSQLLRKQTAAQNQLNTVNTTLQTVLQTITTENNIDGKLFMLDDDLNIVPLSPAPLAQIQTGQ